MIVWEKVAAGTSLTESGVSEWLNKMKITACELENNVHYIGKNIECANDCSKCLKRYLATEINTYEQLSLF